MSTVLAVHAGALAAILQTPALTVPPPQAVMMVELAPSPAAPQTEDLERPPGPHQVRARPEANTAETPRENEKLKEKVVADSDAALPRRAQPKPKRPKSPPQPVSVPDPEPADQQTPTETTTAQPSVAAPPAPVAAAPAPGISHVATASSNRDWRAALLAHLERHMRYPSLAQARREEGVVYIQFAMDCRGRVLSSAVKQRSGYQALDREALATLERAQPLPAPAEANQNTIQMVVPLQFFLR